MPDGAGCSHVFGIEDEHARRGDLHHCARMWRHPVIKVALLLYVGWGAWHWYGDRPVHPPDGILAAGEPQQTELTSGEKLQVGRWTLTMRAHYQVTARILSRERYHFDVHLAEPIPQDLALGWGLRRTTGSCARSNISQSEPLPLLLAHAAANAPIAIDHDHQPFGQHACHTAQLAGEGLEVVRGCDPARWSPLTGELVDGLRESTVCGSRPTAGASNDTGAGACEVLLVDDVSATQPTCRAAARLPRRPVIQAPANCRSRRPRVCIAGRHCARLAFGLRGESRMAAMNSQSCSSDAVHRHIDLRDVDDGLFLPSTNWVVARDVGPVVARWGERRCPEAPRC